MARIDDILAFNKAFVENQDYKQYKTNKYPTKKIAILSCMDTRLTELLPAALNFKNGDVKIIKNAGAVVTHPFGSVMRSLLVAVYDLGVEDILVIGHYDCGMQGMDPHEFLEKMAARGVTEEKINMIRYCGVDIDSWLRGFDDPNTSVLETVKTIRSHPLLPEDVQVYGMVMDPETGGIEEITPRKA